MLPTTRHCTPAHSEGQLRWPARFRTSLPAEGSPAIIRLQEFRGRQAVVGSNHRNHTEDRTMDGFVHLHVHSHYSLLDGANRIGELVETAKGFGMSSLALTDHG